MAPDMTQLRRQREESFTDTCRLDLNVDVTDSSGGYTQSWPSGSSVACNFTTPSAGPDRSGGLIQIAAEERGMIVALPHGTAIKPTDKIRRASDSRMFQVIGVDKPGTFGVQVTAAVIELGE